MPESLEVFEGIRSCPIRCFTSESEFDDKLARLSLLELLTVRQGS
jgi:hypothetical protein